VKQKTITEDKLVDAPYHSTLCQSCNFVCHDRCGLQEISQTGDNAFLGCAAMGGTNNCKCCPNQCCYTVHYHAKKTMKQVTTTMEEILQDIKQKHDQAQKNQSQAQNNIVNITNSKDAIKGAIEQLQKDVDKMCHDLKKICSNFNLVDELNQTIHRLEMEARALTSIEARATADNFVKAIKTIANGLSSIPSASVKKNTTPKSKSSQKIGNIFKSNDDVKEKDSGLDFFFFFFFFFVQISSSNFMIRSSQSEGNNF